jgi:hypothetical protein
LRCLADGSVLIVDGRIRAIGAQVTDHQERPLST